MALFAKKQNGCLLRMPLIKRFVFSSYSRKDSRNHLDSIMNICILCIGNLKSQNLLYVLYMVDF